LSANELILLVSLGVWEFFGSFNKAICIIIAQNYVHW